MFDKYQFVPLHSCSVTELQAGVDWSFFWGRCGSHSIHTSEECLSKHVLLCLLTTWWSNEVICAKCMALALYSFMICYSADAVEFSRSFITSVVLGSDVIARFSYVYVS